LKITQHYLKVEENKADFYIFNTAKKLVIKETTDILNKDRQKQGVIPNVIHSMDATHLIKVVLSAKKEEYYPIVTIHDCFGTHPNKMEKLEDLAILK
jgi:DNA-directed RNA polymerase